MVYGSRQRGSRMGLLRPRSRQAWALPVHLDIPGRHRATDGPRFGRPARNRLSRGRPHTPSLVRRGRLDYGARKPTPSSWQERQAPRAGDSVRSVHRSQRDTALQGSGLSPCPHMAEATGFASVSMVFAGSASAPQAASLFAVSGRRCGRRLSIRRI